MKENCECCYCKKKVDEYFCILCGYNFNECESLWKIDGITLCPKCHPADKMDTIYSKVEINRPFDPNPYDFYDLEADDDE